MARQSIGMTEQPRQYGYYIPLKAAAQRLGVHPNTLSHWVKRGDVPVHLLPSGRMRFDPVELDELMARWRQPVTRQGFENG
jgi:predicted site-specific integrase-resolvase